MEARLRTGTATLVWIENELRFVSLPPDREAGLQTGVVAGKRQRAVVALRNLGTGIKQVRVGIRNTNRSICPTLSVEGAMSDRIEFSRPTHRVCPVHLLGRPSSGPGSFANGAGVRQTNTGSK